MTRYVEIPQLSALRAYKSDGTLVPAVLDPTNGPGLTLGIATYLFPLGGERYGNVVETVVHSISMLWPAGIVGSATIEATNFPKTRAGTDQGPADVTDWDIASKAWQKIDPTLAEMVYATADGVSGVMTKFTCAIAAGAGGAFWNIPDLGALRLRVRLALTTGGFVRVFGHGKLGA
jgi:hypothetical protein